MRYFIDTEFIERGPRYPIELISLGVVAEDGREFYAISRDFNPKHASQWVRDHVLAALPRQCVNPTNPENSPREFHESLVWRKREHIAQDLRAFLGDDRSPEFWGYYSDYDYVVVSQLMGGMAGWPQGWPYYCRDLRQSLDERCFKAVKQLDDSPHSALEDARWIAEAWRDFIGPDTKCGPPREQGVVTNPPTPGRAPH